MLSHDSKFQKWSNNNKIGFFSIISCFFFCLFRSSLNINECRGDEKEVLVFVMMQPFSLSKAEVLFAVEALDSFFRANMTFLAPSCAASLAIARGLPRLFSLRLQLHVLACGVGMRRILFIFINHFFRVIIIVEKLKSTVLRICHAGWLQTR